MKKIIITAVAAATLVGALSACDTGTSDYKHASGHHKGSTATHKSSAPKGTTSQVAALQSAQSYLSMGSGFSRAGLIQQLDSKAGEGFKRADAIWGVNHANADWNAQAVESAKSYKQMGGFSKASLIQQLDSKAGEQFTPAQAAYAAKKVGY
jgi:hypothetical protein